MILISEVIAQIRARLRDTQEPYRFEGFLVLDCLNHIYNDLNVQFKLNVGKFEAKLTPSDNVLTLPFLVLSFERAFLNGSPLPLKAYDERANTLQISAFSDFSSFAVLPKAQASGDLVIFANCSVKLELESKLYSGDFLALALVYGALSLLFGVESSENNLQRVEFYTNLYKKECDRLRGIIASVYENRAFLSPCIQI